MLRLCLILLFIFTLSLSKKIISNEIPSLADLKLNVFKFNQWITSLYPNNPFEIQVNTEGNYSLIVSKDVKENEKVFTFDSKYFLSTSKVHETEYKEIIEELKHKYGYDEQTYFSILLISEYFKSDSLYRPLLDILPKKPKTLAFDYWNKKSIIESHLAGTLVLNKIVDYKIRIEQKIESIIKYIIEPNSNIFNNNI